MERQQLKRNYDQFINHLLFIALSDRGVGENECTPERKRQKKLKGVEVSRSSECNQLAKVRTGSASIRSSADARLPESEGVLPISKEIVREGGDHVYFT